MKRRLSEFLTALRDAGIAITTSEALDANAAVAVVGVSREALREGLAATVIKDQADRPSFDETFEAFFASPNKPRGHRKTAGSTEGSAGSAHRQNGSSTRPAREPERARSEKPQSDDQKQEGQRKAKSGAEQLAHQRAILKEAFREMRPDQIEECAILADAIARRLWAHKRRRRESSRHGTLDVRRTLRRSIAAGGIPLERILRRPRPGRVDLVALCDVSHSCAAASEFLWALLRPADNYFRRVRLFAYVDEPVEIDLCEGMIRPEKEIDYFARSDLGRVLERFWQTHAALLTRNTVMIILGDARNNRRPARADILKRMRGSLKQVIWLNPEPPRRWNTADSVIQTYQDGCDELIAAETPATLAQALRRA